MTDANVSVSFSASVADFVAGVGEAKEALRSFSAPFGEINGQLASLATLVRQAFSAERLQPYRDALTRDAVAGAVLAADRARAAAADALGRRRRLRRRDQAAAARDRRGAAAPRGRAEAEARALRRGGAVLRDHAEREAQPSRARRSNEEYALELAALQRREALGDQSLAARQRIDDMVIEAARRRDDEMTSLTRSALQEQERDYQSFANSIEQAFNSQLRGLLSGTENWHAAFKSVLERPARSRFIEWTETTRRPLPRSARR